MPTAGIPRLELILEAALSAGLLIHRTGGNTARSLATMQRVATALGADRIEPFVSSMNVGLTVGIKGQTETALRKAPHMGVDLAALAIVEQAVQDLEANRCDVQGFLQLLTKLSHGSPPYPFWLRVAGIGVAGGCFAALFHGDACAIAGSVVASAAGIAIRLTMLGRTYRPFVATLVASLVATVLSALIGHQGTTPDAAISASVLFLVPGVPLVNGTSDLLDASPLNGVVRLATATVFMLALVLGMGLALHLIRMGGLL